MGRKRYSLQERALLLEQLANRDQSIAGFAKAHGVSVATLYHWQQQAADAGADTAGSFVEIKHPGASQDAAPLVLHAGGIALRFGQLPDAGWLAVLLQKLAR
jgi:transposase-like protein